MNVSYCGYFNARKFRSMSLNDCEQALDNIQFNSPLLVGVNDVAQLWVHAYVSG